MTCQWVGLHRHYFWKLLCTGWPEFCEVCGQSLHDVNVNADANVRLFAIWDDSTGAEACLCEFEFEFENENEYAKEHVMHNIATSTCTCWTTTCFNNIFAIVCLLRRSRIILYIWFFFVLWILLQHTADIIKMDGWMDGCRFSNFIRCMRKDASVFRFPFSFAFVTTDMTSRRMVGEKIGENGAKIKSKK